MKACAQHRRDIVAFAAVTLALLAPLAGQAETLNYSFKASSATCDAIAQAKPSLGSVHTVRIGLTYKQSGSNRITTYFNFKCDKDATWYAMPKISGVKSLVSYTIDVSSKDITQIRNNNDFTSVKIEKPVSEVCGTGSKNVVENALGTLQNDGSILWSHRKQNGWPEPLGNGAFTALCR